MEALPAARFDGSVTTGHDADGAAVKWVTNPASHTSRGASEGLQFPKTRPKRIPQRSDERTSPLHPGSHIARRVAAFGFATLLALADVPARAGESPAPSFTVKGLDGKAVRLADYKNRPVVLDFWATWCAPCRASMPHLNDIHARFRGSGLAVIGLSVDETGPVPVRKFANGLGVKFTIAMANDDVLDAYGPIRSIPTTVFINRRGEIVRRVVGFIDPETMDAYVREIVR